jgi:hypothetical protein
VSKILHSVTVRGKGHTWCIDTYITLATAQDWRDDGLEVYETLNTIPKWYVDLGGSVRLWCFVQDVFHFKNPWSDK